jgi:uncharacterized protein
MNVTQSIHNPLGINVFGSTLIRVEPDLASLSFAVSHLAQHPNEAFREAQTLAQKVRSYLAQAGISDVGSSRISLHEERRYVNGESRFAGYSARVAFNVLLRDLDRVEEILSGIVDAGANEINSVEFQTSRLKELRAEARQRAVRAAYEKANIYCEATQVKLGGVLHIEDVNPDLLRGYEGHVVREVSPDDEGPLQAIDPGSIMVKAAVMICFQIEK